MDRVGNEQYTRELFHEATIFVFPALFHYWKLYVNSANDKSQPDCFIEVFCEILIYVVCVLLVNVCCYTSINFQAA